MAEQNQWLHIAITALIILRLIFISTQTMYCRPTVEGVEYRGVGWGSSASPNGVIRRATL